MTHVILKLVTGGVVFGGLESKDSSNIIVNKPYTYIVNEEGIPGIAPYDTFSFQGELQQMVFPRTTVLQYGDFGDCKEARDAYISVTSGIVMPSQKIII
jgi:hypothetical protein